MMEARVSERNLLQTWMEGIKKRLRTAGKYDQVTLRLRSLKSDEQRIEHLLGLECVNDALERLKTKLPDNDKSNTESETLRLRANRLFKERNYQKSLNLYNESVCTAEVDILDDSSECSNAFALALSSRSAALFHLQYYEESIRDIELSISSGYPEESRHKLFDRKGRCLIKLQKFEEARHDLEKALENVEKNADNMSESSKANLISNLKSSMSKCQDICNNNSENYPDANSAQQSIAKIKRKTMKEPPDLTQANGKYPNLSNSCNVARNGARGTHIVANRDILPGEVILVEKPYAAFLLPSSQFTHCFHCLQRLIVALPCVHCRTAMFCSSECRQKAVTCYHSHECLIWDMLVSCGVDRFGLLAIRALSQTPIYVIKYKSDNTVTTENVDASAKSFTDILNLVAHTNDRSGDDFLHRCLTSLFIVHLFKSSSYFTEEIAMDSETDLMKLVATVLLKLLQVLPCNAHSITELSVESKSLIDSSPIEIGVGIYATQSLFNHSCDPLITRNHYGTKTVARAIAYIAKGQEITDNYGAVFAIQSKHKRQSRLKPQYHFSCNCIACCENWPQSKEEACFEPKKWKCIICQEQMFPVDVDQICQFKKEIKGSDGNRSLSNFDKQLKVLECRKCKRSELIQEKISILKTSGIRFLEAIAYLKKGKTEESLPILFEHLSVLESHVYHPWRDIIVCQEAVKQCFSLMGNCHNKA